MFSAYASMRMAYYYHQYLARPVSDIDVCFHGTNKDAASETAPYLSYIYVRIGYS